MIQIRNIIRKNHLKVHRYHKENNVIIITTDKGKYVVKDKNNNGILEYLSHRHLNIFPKIVDTDSDYNLYEYIEDNNIPSEQKMNDLIKEVAHLHASTSFNKKVDESSYKQLYEDLSNNIIYLKEYYNDMISIIDEKEFMSPDEYLLARNISIILASLNYCEEHVDKWFENLSNLKQVRVSVIHNNLRLDHFLQNEHNYFISWDKAKIDIPVFDLYKLYLNHHNKYYFTNLLTKYEKIFPLLDDEKKLLFTLISLPSKIVMNDNTYNNCLNIKQEIKRLYQSQELVHKYPNKNS